MRGVLAVVVLVFGAVAIAAADTHYDTLERRNPQGLAEPVARAHITIRRSADCSVADDTIVTDEDGNWSYEIPATANYDVLFLVCAAGTNRGLPCTTSLDCGGETCGVSQPNTPLVQSGGATGSCP